MQGLGHPASYELISWSLHLVLCALCRVGLRSLGWELEG